MNNSVSFPTDSENAFLIGVRGEFEKKEFLIPRSGIMIGRDTVSCNVIFSEKNESISRHHCMIHYNPQTRMFFIKDLNSTNGTFLQNGVRITPDKPNSVYSGSRFWLGNDKTVFELRIKKE